MGPLDISTEPAKTLAQLTQLERPPRTRGPVRLAIRLDDVECVDAPSILYLCSRIQRLGTGPRKVWGMYPVHLKARVALAEAGFHWFLYGKAPPLTGPRQLALFDGTAEKVVPIGIPQKVQAFLQALHPGLATEEKGTIYAAVHECLQNVREHAYTGCSRRPIWQVVGSYDADSFTSSVAILDVGVGIVETVRPKVRGGELFQRLKDKWYGLGAIEYLTIATTGLRTESRDSSRGKGLNDLREFAIGAENRRLHVLSSGAMLTWSKQHHAEPLARTIPDFDGTIVCLQIAGSGAAEQ